MSGFLAPYGGGGERKPRRRREEAKAEEKGSQGGRRVGGRVRGGAMDIIEAEGNKTRASTRGDERVEVAKEM